LLIRCATPDLWLNDEPDNRPQAAQSTVPSRVRLTRGGATARKPLIAPGEPATGTAVDVEDAVMVGDAVALGEAVTVDVFVAVLVADEVGDGVELGVTDTRGVEVEVLLGVAELAGRCVAVAVPEGVGDGVEVGVEEATVPAKETDESSICPLPWSSAIVSPITSD
jgi:hypothetical protein